jgi:hypothetical protein
MACRILETRGLLNINNNAVWMIRVEHKIAEAGFKLRPAAQEIYTAVPHTANLFVEIG